VEKLHAFPYEINAKKPSNATLCAQFAHCTALHHLKQGDEQARRLDCGSGEKDNGFKLTCIYIIRGGEGAELELRTAVEGDGRVQMIRPKPDRLVMFQSQRVINAITPLQGHDEELVYMTFWIHGKALK
jgi:hypothetical protein